MRWGRTRSFCRCSTACATSMCLTRASARGAYWADWRVFHRRSMRTDAFISWAPSMLWRSGRAMHGAPIDAIAEVLRVPGFDALLSEDILREMWEKWVFIAAAAATTSLMRATIGDIMAADAHDIPVRRCRNAPRSPPRTVSRRERMPRKARWRFSPRRVPLSPHRCCATSSRAAGSRRTTSSAICCGAARKPRRRRCSRPPSRICAPMRRGASANPARPRPTAARIYAG